MSNFLIKLLSIAFFLCSAIGIIEANVKGIDITYFCLSMGVSALTYLDTKLDELKGEEDDEDVHE
jgi:hypothetical protein